MNPSIIGAPLQLIGAGVNAYRSNKFMKEAQGQLENLVDNPIKPYTAGSQLVNYSAQARNEAAAPQGLTPAEVADYQANQARTEAAQFANAQKVGGGRGLLGILNANQATANTKLAGASAQSANNQ